MIHLRRGATVNAHGTSITKSPKVKIDLKISWLETEQCAVIHHNTLCIQRKVGADIVLLVETLFYVCSVISGWDKVERERSAQKN